MKYKDKIYICLKQHMGNYISGQAIANELSLTRAAVNKNIEALEREGYKIKKVRHAGYLLCEDSDELSAIQTATILQKKVDIRYYNSIDSTNLEAKRLISAGNDSTILVLADEQTEGRGRQGKSFYSPAKTGLYMSLVLHPEKTLNETASITTAAAAFVCSAIEETTNLKPQIKWVNDIYIDDMKVAGILTEAITDCEVMSVSSVIIGIGININTDKFPQMDDKPGSLGVKINKNVLAANIAHKLIDYNTSNNSKYMEYYKKHSMVIGKKIVIQKNKGDEIAEAVDITNNGALVVINEKGKKRELTSGTIRII